ncbi:uncharacterized protein LOC135110016 [Scylla paramamosain]|uniref:uncharacterized protein LOC135110016 n=1 Tax=Scylla paramamosain TaxID=85552 RepID=UPI003082E030
MVTTCRWAVGRWEEDLRRQLGGLGVGNKTWWSLVKGKQGLNRQDTVPPLTRPDGTVATSSKDKAQLLATLFARKMEVDDPERSPPLLEQQCRDTVTKVEVTQGLVERLLLLCLLTGKYLALSVERGPGSFVHKRSSRSDRKNFRPISLTAVVGKVFERVVADVVCRHLQDNYLLPDQQFGLRPGRSTSDLLMVLTGGWHDALDGGLDTVVVALDITGAFDRVWHGGLLENLRAKRIQGDLLQLLGDYLQGRTLQVVVNGQASEALLVRASVPQGSVPVLWNTYVDDLLRQLPAVSAYADDCTLSCTYPRHESVPTSEEINQELGSVKILGVEVDRGLRFDRHIKHIALKASHRVSSLRRVASLLDRRGSKLDGIQRRALRLVEAAGAPAHHEAPVDTVEHRRDVAAFVVLHKTQVQGLPHLVGLRLPPAARVTSRDTRTVLSSGDSVEVPRSRSSQHQRTFRGRVSRMWNVFASSVPHIRGMDTQDVKLAAHHCRGSFPTPLLTILA